MSHIQLDQDIRSLTEFRANASAFIERVKAKKRPLILTQHGKSSAVLIDVEDYQKMIDKIHLLEEIAAAKQQFGAHSELDHKSFMIELRSTYAK